MGTALACAAPGVGRCETAISRESAQGRTYHVDPAGGDDTNDGLAPSRPIETYAAREFSGGDTVLFKRGSIIRDMLYTRDGTEDAPLVYGAYGAGPRPVFLGSEPVGVPERWVEERPSVWRYADTPTSEVCNLIFNGGESCGILRWELEDLAGPGDWHYTAFGAQDQGGGDLYLYSPTNPGRVYMDIECVLWGQRRLTGGRQHVVLEDLRFENSGVHGYHEQGVRNVVIRNCAFRFIGGAVWDRARRMRFGNAVELWNGASDVRVEGCFFDNIYDSAVTHQGGETRNIPERIYFRDNLFVDCGLTAYESREPSREVYFEHNTCINSGGGFSMQGENPSRVTDPYPQPVGYHVWAWMIEPHTQPGKVYVRHNIFCESYGPAVCLSIDPADAENFVLEHNCYRKTLPGRLIEWGGGRSYMLSEFARYQAECGRDTHSRIAKPLFVDEQGCDFWQRGDSQCLGAGMRLDVECGWEQMR